MPIPKTALAFISAIISLFVVAVPSLAVEADGTRDFDFNQGTWRTDITRVIDPFSSSTATMKMNGTVTVRKVWNGAAWLEEIEADGPKGHWEGMTLFVYNPTAHQWSQTFAASAVGVFTPALIGSFKEGRGELYSQDTFNGRSI